MWKRPSITWTNAVGEYLRLKKGDKRTLWHILVNGWQMPCKKGKSSWVHYYKRDGSNLTVRIVERLPVASFYKSATNTGVEESKFPDLQWRFILKQCSLTKAPRFALSCPPYYPTNHLGRGDGFMRGPLFFPKDSDSACNKFRHSKSSAVSNWWCKDKKEWSRRAQRKAWHASVNFLKGMVQPAQLPRKVEKGRRFGRKLGESKPNRWKRHWQSRCRTTDFEIN